ncbi:hypothetical protein EVAR_78788_1 [Eumeta japonica]|uniref:Uncharacterized protein n=1 Tax=Eumeta variegata TaxID=151549 RepID=A0A4C1T421_EUMVA|nr:hypothetical protein EVAR_78788_1 [Eumeta japonica]
MVIKINNSVMRSSMKKKVGKNKAMAFERSKRMIECDTCIRCKKRKRGMQRLYHMQICGMQLPFWERDSSYCVVDDFSIIDLTGLRLEVSVGGCYGPLSPIRSQCPGPNVLSEVAWASDF